MVEDTQIQDVLAEYNITFQDLSEHLRLSLAQMAWELIFWRKQKDILHEKIHLEESIPMLEACLEQQVPMLECKLVRQNDLTAVLGTCEIPHTSSIDTYIAINQKQYQVLYLLFHTGDKQWYAVLEGKPNGKMW